MQNQNLSQKMYCYVCNFFPTLCKARYICYYHKFRHLFEYYHHLLDKPSYFSSIYFKQSFNLSSRYIINSKGNILLWKNFTYKYKQGAAHKNWNLKHWNIFYKCNFFQRIYTSFCAPNIWLGLKKQIHSIYPPFYWMVLMPHGTFQWINDVKIGFLDLLGIL